jgi:hypothetical protein
MDQLNADSPITTRNEDALCYWAFAESLAKGITWRIPKDGFIVGVQAHWGMGKTSAINLILDDDAAPSHLITDPERTDYGARLKKLRCGITLVAERSDRRNSHQLWRQMISSRSATHQRDRSKARLGSKCVGSAAAIRTTGIGALRPSRNRSSSA